MEYQVKFDQGMINRGNWKKIKECMKKAERGETMGSS